jgi:hypothetical protein
VKLFMRNHSEPGTVNSSGTPFYSHISGPVWRNVAQLSYLVVCSTNIAEPLVPQLDVSWDFRRYRCSKLRCRRGIEVDEAIGVVVAEHFTSAGERKGFERHIRLVEHLERLGISGVGQEGGAKRVEDASEWVVSRDCSACET